ncbi:MAG TPA: YggS family pyridoxal phosphate-dependent enzyme [Thermomicrobiales bacterium]|nr:YggS family pyridoxal phosphate-dependent enzyme [Thermomicrobiales bacterium]HRA31346.1 YggS family pyridoxal phosphate-dependent enzyme [Thermomicrobiales bacterium]
MTSIITDIAARIAAVEGRITLAAERAGRDPSEITLVGVSKTVGRADVDAAYAAGMRHFGENRIQDALVKFEDSPDDLVLHLIGSLQTNKVRHAVGRFQLIHSVDRLSLVDALQARCEAASVTQPILLQVNVAREEQKHGCDPDDAAAMVEAVLARKNLELRGLMTMAPLTATPEEARPVFAELRQLRDRLKRDFPGSNLADLSMGMTNDYEVAVEEGATIVRVGRAIFAPPPGA